MSGWETRVHRGGHLKDIYRMVHYERRQMDPEEKRENLPRVIITGGGNDWAEHKKSRKAILEDLEMTEFIRHEA